MQKDSRKRLNIFLSRDSLEDILRNVGVKIIAETEHDLLGYCPFHHNVDSPAFNISKTQPYPWRCWNGACDQKGNIFTLLHKKGYSPNEIKKMLISGEVEPNDLVDYLRELLAEAEEEASPWKGYDYSRFKVDDEAAGYPAKKYAISRGITEEAYEHFHMGYSAKKDMLIIPAFHANGDMAGVIGRSIQGKQYRYSAGLQRGSLVWNLNKATQTLSDEIILTEGSLDAVYVWQAGHKNVGAILGSAVSPVQWKEIRKHFGSITCFFDNDEPGKKLTDSIIDTTRGLMVSVVQYPSGVKDPGDLTPEQIRTMMEYRRTNLDLLFQN